MRSLIYLLIIPFLASCSSHERISLFPMQQYDQTISHWVKPTSSDYNKPLLTSSQQKVRKAEWDRHYFGEDSPWDGRYIQKIFSQPIGKNLESAQQEKIILYGNKDKSTDQIGYGSNFRPYENEWIMRLQNNINLAQFSRGHYLSSQRAIAIDNINGRELPTNEVHFYDHRLAGQGYPFDNLQSSMIWAGTPLYILGETRDHSWSLVRNPSFTTWVQNTKIAKVNTAFVDQWRLAAGKGLIAITRTQTPVQDIENKLYRFPGYIGMTFPGSIKKDGIHILIPVSDERRQARIHHAILSPQDAVVMPWLPTPHHFSDLINQSIGRPYGWGGMYFYNDCASELKNLYAPFGIWVPIHSSNQVDDQQYLITKVDASSAKASERLDFLTQKGHPWMTIVYIGGHVFLYLGNYPDPLNPHHLVALSYQNIWGLRPKNATPATDRRVVIGNAVLFPILKMYPENRQLASLLDKKYFEMAYLDEFPMSKKPEKTDIHSLSLP